MRLKDAKDVTAWDEFASIYSPVIYRVAIGRGFQPADAENLVQEVLTAVARSVSQWLEREDRGSFRAWLLRISRNKSVDMLTRRGSRSLGRDGSIAEQLLAQIPAPSDLTRELDLEYGQSVFKWAAEKVRQTVADITWKAFWMTSVDGLSVEDVAEKLQVGTGQVYCARSRIMAKIKKLVQEFEVQS